MTKEYSIQELLDMIDGLPETMNTRQLTNSATGYFGKGKQHVTDNLNLDKNKPCSVDGGLTVYPSFEILKKCLGRGIAGAKHPNFQFLPKDTPSNFVDVTHDKSRGVHIQKPCTVDGITIYPSLKDLAKALGYGKAGTRHPNFRYV